MTPHLMTVLHNPDTGQRGDCMRACLASVVEADPATMPNFADHHGPLAWWDAMRHWLRTRLEVDLVMIDSLDQVTRWPDDPRWAHAIGTVQSRRGPWGHCVVVDPTGRIVHDPYPDPAGRVGGQIRPYDTYFLVVDRYDPYPTPIADLPVDTVEAA